jgi:hypothetical protein
MSVASSSLASLSINPYNTTATNSALEGEVRRPENTTVGIREPFSAASMSSEGASSELVQEGSSWQGASGGRSQPAGSESDNSISSHSGGPPPDHHNLTALPENEHIPNVSLVPPLEVNLSSGSVVVIPNHSWRDKGFLGVAEANEEEGSSTEAIPSRIQHDASVFLSGSNTFAPSRGVTDDAELSEASSTDAVPNNTQREEGSLFARASASRFGNASDEDSLGSSDDALPSHTRDASGFADSRFVGSDQEGADLAAFATTLRSTAAVPTAEMPRSALRKAPPPVLAPAEAPPSTDFEPALHEEKGSARHQWTRTGLAPLGGARVCSSRGFVLVASEGTMTSATPRQLNRRNARSEPTYAPSAFATATAPERRVVMMRDAAVGPPTPQSNRRRAVAHPDETGAAVSDLPVDDESSISDDSLGEGGSWHAGKESDELRGRAAAARSSETPHTTTAAQRDGSPRTASARRSLRAAAATPETVGPPPAVSRATSASPRRQSATTRAALLAAAATAQGDAWAVAADVRQQRKRHTQQTRAAWEARAAARADAAAAEERARRVEQRARAAAEQAAAALAAAETRRRADVDGSAGTGSGTGAGASVERLRGSDKSVAGVSARGNSFSDSSAAPPAGYLRTARTVDTRPPRQTLPSLPPPLAPTRHSEASVSATPLETTPSKAPRPTPRAPSLNNAPDPGVRGASSVSEVNLPRNSAPVALVRLSGAALDVPSFALLEQLCRKASAALR